MTYDFDEQKQSKVNEIQNLPLPSDLKVLIDDLANLEGEEASISDKLIASKLSSKEFKKAWTEFKKQHPYLNWSKKLLNESKDIDFDSANSEFFSIEILIKSVNEVICIQEQNLIVTSNLFNEKGLSTYSLLMSLYRDFINELKLVEEGFGSNLHTSNLIKALRYEVNKHKLLRI